MGKEPKVEFIAPAVGAKAPLKVMPSGTSHLGTGVEVSSVDVRDTAMTNLFLAIEAYSSFKAFAREYGVEMFRADLARILKAAESKEDPIALPLHLFMTGSSEIAEWFLEELWQRLQRQVRKVQAEVRVLLTNRETDLPEYYRQLQQGLSPVRVQVTVFSPGASSLDSPRYALFLRARGIKEACFLQVALAGEDASLEVCGRDSCSNVFIRSRQGKGTYCSTRCKEKARRDRKVKDPLPQYKNALRSRVARQRGKPIDQETEAAIRNDINRARSKRELEKIEKKYGLQVRAAGRPRKAEKGDGR